jgi:hypothetical protein
MITGVTTSGRSLRRLKRWTQFIVTVGSTLRGALGKIMIIKSYELFSIELIRPVSFSLAKKARCDSTCYKTFRWLWIFYATRKSNSSTSEPRILSIVSSDAILI